MVLSQNEWAVPSGESRAGVLSVTSSKTCRLGFLRELLRILLANFMVNGFYSTCDEIRSITAKFAKKGRQEHKDSQILF